MLKDILYMFLPTVNRAMRSRDLTELRQLLHENKTTEKKNTGWKTLCLLFILHPLTAFLTIRAEVHSLVLGGILALIFDAIA